MEFFFPNQGIPKNKFIALKKATQLFVYYVHPPGIRYLSSQKSSPAFGCLMIKASSCAKLANGKML